MKEKNMSIVAIIPARGGSKRIPGKNIKLFAGKPIIAYSIAAARKSGLFQSDYRLDGLSKNCQGRRKIRFRGAFHPSR